MATTNLFTFVLRNILLPSLHIVSLIVFLLLGVRRLLQSIRAATNNKWEKFLHMEHVVVVIIFLISTRRLQCLFNTGLS